MNAQCPSSAPRLALLVAVMFAAAIPLRAFGVATEQTALGLALIFSLIGLAQNQNTRTALTSAVLSRQGKFAITALVGLGISVPFSYSPAQSIEIWARTAAFVFAVTVIWAVVSHFTSTHRPMLAVLVGTAVALAALALSALFGTERLAWLSLGEIGHAFATDVQHVDPAAVYKPYGASVMCLIPIVVWAGRRMGGYWRWYGYVYVPMALGVMVLTYNRSALAGFVAMMLVGTVVLALAKRRQIKTLFATALICAAATIAWIGTKEIELSQTLEQTTGGQLLVETYLPEWLLDPHRQNIWKFVFGRFLDHPIVGIGIDQINTVPGAHVLVKGLDSSAYVVPSHPHNWVLEILSETGVLGFLPVAAALLFIASRIIRRYIVQNDETDLALILLMAGFWSSALFNFSIWASWWQLSFLTLFAILSVMRQSHPHETKERGGSVR